VPGRTDADLHTRRVGISPQDWRATPASTRCSFRLVAYVSVAERDTPVSDDCGCPGGETGGSRIAAQTRATLPVTGVPAIRVIALDGLRYGPQPD
jgi:hypothetical protein